jgi:hypothetical protein
VITTKHLLVKVKQDKLPPQNLRQLGQALMILRMIFLFEVYLL